MGKDLKGISRGKCRQCEDEGDDCDSYEIPAEAPAKTDCRDCGHLPAKHRKETKAPEINVVQAQAPVSAQIEEWKDKKIGYIEKKEKTEEIMNSSHAATKNQTVFELYNSRFSKGWSKKNYADCQTFKNNWVNPETKRRIELKLKIISLHNSVTFLMSPNSNALGYFLQAWYIPKSIHKQNFKVHLKKIGEHRQDITDIQDELSRHEDNNSVSSGEINKPKFGCEPLFSFNDKCRSELLKIKANLDDLEIKAAPIDKQFSLYFALPEPSKVRDQSRAKKENDKKSRKRKALVEKKVEAKRSKYDEDNVINIECDEFIDEDIIVTEIVASSGDGSKTEMLNDNAVVVSSGDKKSDTADVFGISDGDESKAAVLEIMENIFSDVFKYKLRKKLESFAFLK